MAPRADESPATAGDGRPRPRVLVHIGEPKTGTTFLQQAMWSNRAELAAQGVVLPGHHPQDHFRASQDLRGIEKRPDDPAGSWTGEWEILAHQARQAPRAAVISHELFSAVDEQQAQRAVRSRSEEHTSELQSRQYLVCRLLLEKKKMTTTSNIPPSRTENGLPPLAHVTRSCP